MSDDYLWDKSGTPDPEVEKLERSLASLAARERPLELPERIAAPEPASGWRGRLARLVGVGGETADRRGPIVLGLSLRTLAVAAGVIAVAGAVSLWMVTRPAPGWQVATLSGAPRVAEGALAAGGRLGVGQWLVTDAASRARVTVGKIGEVLVEPNTRLELLEAGDHRQRLHLAVGMVTAVILAPPREFVVETPSARAVDLGCAYTLEVDPMGGGLVTVLAGWVSFESQGQESFIPAGARCATRPGSGPGTPCFTDATDAFKNALALLDVAPDPAARAAQLPRVLAEARREDAFTLWHLLARLQGEERDAVFARLAVLVPPPPPVTRAGVMAGDRAMLDRWWDALGFGEMKWWRLWERSWPEPSGRPGAPDTVTAARPNRPS